MSEYTSTRAGFQRAMEWSLTGPPNEAKLFVEAISTPGFYQILNGQLLSYDAYIKHIEEMRTKVGDYKPVLHEFLRDGDQLAARMTGIISIDGVAVEFESFIFAKVDKSGRLEWLKERAVSGPVGGAP
ncbi:hypothetical protein INS49_012283 [Diaporthe citri]|uniref:uncharacterized protein n=1 Tax=Diaporthe citri TaxID=83186 RepID=UPI001C827E1C|nr:uncharacterized protein INS49_012283 [Diaporthe citri]KAG6358764.1 hypothetical protein INS49_012283 [Diaporthe citri]